MLTNYFKIALRNLSKQKVLAFINIFGLSVGIACFSLFMLYALNEFNFDRFNTNAPNIYRVYLWFDEMNGSPAGASVYHPMPLGPAMKQDLSDVENYVRFHEGWGENLIKAGGTITREQVSFADPSFLNVFSFKLKYGNAEWSMVNGQW